MGRRPATQREQKKKASILREAKLKAALDYLPKQKSLSCNGTSSTALAHAHSVPAATFWRRARGGRSLRDSAEAKQKITREEEDRLVEECIAQANKHTPLRPGEVQAHALAILHARTPPGAPPPRLGKNWSHRFLERHELRNYRPSTIGDECSCALNPKNVGEYFDYLEEIDEHRHIKPENKWAMDESPVQLGKSEEKQVVAPVGKKRQYAKRNSNRESLTVTATICADGRALVPYIIFKGKGLHYSWSDNNVMNADLAYSKSGSMDGEIALRWLEFFDSASFPDTHADWRQLSLDSHKTHLTKEFLDYAVAHQIELISYIPNSTHIMQGLDVCIFSPFKRYLDEMQREHERDTGKGLDKITLLRKLHEPWERAFTPANIKAAFQKTGLHPIDHAVITPEMMGGSMSMTVNPSQPLMHAPEVDAVLLLLKHVTQSAPKSQLVSPAASSSHITENPSLSLTPRTHDQLIQAKDAIERTQAAWLVRSPSQVTSAAQISTPRHLCLPTTPPSARAALSDAAHAFPDNWGIEEITVAFQNCRSQLIKSHNREVHAHHVISSNNATIAIQGLAIAQQSKKLYGREDEQKRKGEANWLLPTKVGRALTGNVFRAAVDADRAVRESRKRQVENRRNERAVQKKRTQGMKEKIAQRKEWRKGERDERQRLDREDQAAWEDAKREATTQHKKPPLKPHPRRKAQTPEVLRKTPDTQQDSSDNGEVDNASRESSEVEDAEMEDES